MRYAIIHVVKLAMAMNTAIGEEETQRQQEIRTRLERAEREKSHDKFRRELAGESRKSFLFVIGAVVVLFFMANSGRLLDYTATVTHKLAARASTHSVIKQSALQYEDEVDQIAKQ